MALFLCAVSSPSQSISLTRQELSLPCFSRAILNGSESWAKDSTLEFGNHRGKLVGSASVDCIDTTLRWLKSPNSAKEGLCQLGSAPASHTLHGRHPKIHRYCTPGHLQELIVQLCPDTDVATYASLLQRCSIEKALFKGECVHERIARLGHVDNTYLNNLLVQMYGKCGSLQHARAVFDNMVDRNLHTWTSMLAACAQNGHPVEALQIFSHMQAEGFKPAKISFTCVLRACASLGVLEQGREIHASVICNGWESDVVVGTALVNLYGKCGSLDDAKVVFSKMPQHDVVSWSAMIAIYSQNGHGKEALQLSGPMQADGFEPDKISFVCILDACASVAALEEGRQIHATVVGNGWESFIVLGNALINMYGKCMSLDDAITVFTDMPRRNEISWSGMISVCSQNGHGSKALQLFNQLEAESIEPNEIMFICVLDACASVAAIEEGQKIHANVVGNGWESVVVGTALINMYGKCESLDDARAVFAEMPQRDVVSWNAMIAVCAQNRHDKEALQLFAQMEPEGFLPNEITFISILDACGSMSVIEQGRDIHARVVGNKWESCVVFGNALMKMYGKCRGLDDAWDVFAEMPERDLVSWNTMISVCTQNGHAKQALDLCGKLQAEGFAPDKITIICVLDACASVASLDEGQVIHADVVSYGWESDVVVAKALLNMYGTCGSLDDARAVFGDMLWWDVVSWSAMISVCAQNGHGKEALQLFDRMQAESLTPDKIAFICVLDACASIAALEEGRDIHASIVANGWESDCVVGNALLNMYGKCGSLDDARDVFAEMPCWDVVSWNAMITVCTQNGYGKEALQLFSQMQVEGFDPDKITFMCVLDACAGVAAAEEGQQIHASVVASGWESDVIMGNALVNMYGKCGNLHDARAVFAEMSQRDVVSWSALIAVSAQNGHGKEALQLFRQMEAENIKPNEITFICILAACSHMGLVAEGRQFFTSMMQDYHILPSMDHYLCMIDLVGRAGFLDKAEELIHTMPFAPAASAWLSLLSSCRIHGDVERGVRATNHIINLDEKNAFPYVLLANIHAAVGLGGKSRNTRLINNGEQHAKS